MTFAAYILDTRRALRLTQAELAARLHVDKQSISNWECGRNTPWETTQAAIRHKLTGMVPAVAPRHRASINERILK